MCPRGPSLQPPLSPHSPLQYSGFSAEAMDGPATMMLTITTSAASASQMLFKWRARACCMRCRPFVGIASPGGGSVATAQARTPRPGLGMTTPPQQPPAINQSNATEYPQRKSNVIRIIDIERERRPRERSCKWRKYATMFHLAELGRDCFWRRQLSEDISRRAAWSTQV